MKHRLMTSAALLASAIAFAFTFAPAAWADKNAAIDEMEACLEFVNYGGGVIFAEQIPKDDWQRLVLIDAHDTGQFAKGHISGALNMDWRQVLARRKTIPKDKPVLIYGNTGLLSAQAGFAWRVRTTCASCRAGWKSGRPKAGLTRLQKPQRQPGTDDTPHHCSCHSGFVHRRANGGEAVSQSD